MTDVLIVDKDLDKLRPLQDLLAENGYTVTYACDGKLAYQVARKYPPELIISDLLMPEMDGLTLLCHWKSDDRLKSIPFVLSSETDTGDEGRRLAHSLGADAMILKQAQPEHILAQLDQALSAPPRSPMSASLEDHPADIVHHFIHVLVKKLDDKVTQLKQVNEALWAEIIERKKLHKTQESLINALPAHVALLAPSGTVLAVSAGWTEFAQASAWAVGECGLGANFLEACDSAEMSEGVRDILADATHAFTLDYSCHAGEEPRWYRLVVLPAPQTDGTGAVLTHIDITELKEAERRARWSAERLELAVDTASIGIWDWTPSDGKVSWNQRMYQIHGLPQGTPIDEKGWMELLHPDDRLEREANLKRLVEEGGRNQREFRIIRPSGTIRHLHSAKMAILGERGEPTRVVGLCWDITERKMAEQERLRRESRLALVQKIAGVCSFEMDLGKEEALRWSDEMYQLLGREPGSFKPSTEAFLQSVHPEDREELRRVVDRSHRFLNTEPVEFRIVKPGDRVRWLRRQSMVTRDPDGKPLGLVVTFLDFTEAKVAEQERLALQLQLSQSQKMEALGQLTGGIAHDFNNLLAVVLGDAEMLQELVDPVDDMKMKLTEEIISVAESGAELTQRLLAFARKQPLDPEETDINLLIRNMQSLLRRTLGETIEIETGLEERLWGVEVDRRQMEAALLNLAINSRDAMPDGGSLTIETANVVIDEGQADLYGEMSAGHYVVISVSDNGTGIPKENLAKVIDPFFTTKPVGKGTGLGLSMVFGFAKQSHGHMTIYSDFGHGTTVRIYLPRTAADDAAEEMRSRGRMAQVKLPQGTESILFVEDDPRVSATVGNMLSTLGYKVTVAASAREAIAILALDTRFDLLFTDLVLAGGMNGAELSRLAMARQPGLKVLFTSGYTEDAIAHQGQLDEGAVLLSKPFKRSTLAEKLREVIDGPLPVGLPGGVG